MQTKRQQNSAFLKLLFASMLMHGSAIVGYLILQDQRLATPKNQTVSVQLRSEPPPPAPQPLKEAPQENPDQQQVTERQPPEPEEHLPAHNSDEFASNNQRKEVEGEIVAGGGNERSTENIKEAEKSPNATNEKKDVELTDAEIDEVTEDQLKEKAREVVSTTGASGQTVIGDAIGNDESELSDSTFSRLTEEFSIEALPSLEELAIPGEFLEGIGNLELLSDGELSDAIVEQPFSENESKELQLVNRYLARMNQQVLSFWINPYKGNKLHRGIIKVELSSNGYLENAFIYRSSGHTLLDISVLDAIRAVPRYDVPDNEIITARYYTNLSFHYSSVEEETELMPFEQEREEVN